MVSSGFGDGWGEEGRTKKGEDAVRGLVTASVLRTTHPHDRVAACRDIGAGSVPGRSGVEDVVDRQIDLAEIGWFDGHRQAVDLEGDPEPVDL